MIKINIDFFIFHSINMATDICYLISSFYHSLQHITFLYRAFRGGSAFDHSTQRQAL